MANGIFPAGGVTADKTFNAAPIETTENCQALFYSTRCNVKFDAISYNAIISEIGNLVNCGGFKYDCSRLDNLCLAVNGMIDNRLSGCWNNINIPEIENACSFQYLTIGTDANGCTRLMRYSEASADLGTAWNNTVWGTSTGNFYRPANPADGTTFYWYDDLMADIAAGRLNENKLRDNQLVHLTVNLPCRQTVELTCEQIMNFNPSDNSGKGTKCILVYRVDGVFPRNSDGNISDIGLYSNFDTRPSTSRTITLPAGIHGIDVYVCGYDKTFGKSTQVLVVGSSVTSGTTLTAKLSS